MNPLKKLAVILILASTASFQLCAQNVGISSNGATPDGSAMLDIVSGSKGLLIPRVSLTSTNAAGPITSPATSLLVYNTNTAGTPPNNVSPGYYYWTGISWSAFNTASTGSWALGGNAVAGNSNLGTTSNYPLPFITNNIERMRLLANGALAIGATSLDATHPEKLLVDAGITTSFNVISGKGTINNYLQLNIQNKSTGTSASSDVVASANNATEVVNFVDMGINSSGYTNTSLPILGGANTAYLYATGNDFIIGNATPAKPLRFFTGGSASTNEAMRIDGDGHVMIGTDTNDGEKLLIDAEDNQTAIGIQGEVNSYLEINVQNASNGNLASSDIVATADNGDSTSVYIDMGINSGGYSNNNANILNGSNVAYLYAHGKDFKIGNGTPGRNLIFFTNPQNGDLGQETANGIERIRIEPTGDVGIGTSQPNYKLEVNGSAAKPGGGDWSNASDRRLKKEIRPFNDGLQVLSKIAPVWYQYNGLGGQPNDGKNYVGVIAQDIQPVAPYTISTFKDGDSQTEYLSYDGSAITYILINAVKEQQQIIETLKEQIEDQEKRLQAIEARLK